MKTDKHERRNTDPPHGVDRWFQCNRCGNQWLPDEQAIPSVCPCGDLHDGFGGIVEEHTRSVTYQPIDDSGEANEG